MKPCINKIDMKRLDFFIVFLFLSISGFSQYDYVGHSGNDCSSDMTISYTYTEYDQGSHGHGYRLYRDGNEIRHAFGEFGGYYVESLDFLNDSVGFVTQSYQGIIGVYRTVDYGSNWEWIGGQNLAFQDIYFVNQYTAYLIGREHHLTDNVTIERIIKNKQRTVFAIDSVTTLTTNFNDNDTIMGESLCVNQQNLSFNIQKSGTYITFEINFNHILSKVQNISFKKKVSIYPNPANDIIYLDTDNSQVQNVSIYDCTGKLILNKSIDNNFVNISGLEKGIYILNLRGNEGDYTTKVIVE